MEVPFNKWLVADLKEYVSQFDITDANIKGTGKNGNMIKTDYVKTALLLKSTPYVYKDEFTQPQNINEDIWFNIMLHLRYKDLKKTCLTDKMALNVCNNISFWKNKFENDNLEIIGRVPTNIKEWIKKYKIASNAAHMANKITNVLKLDSTYTIVAYIRLDFDMLKIIPEFEEYIKKARRQFVGDFLISQWFYIQVNKGLSPLYFKFVYQNDNGDTTSKFIAMITFDDLYHILYRYLHYFSSKDLTDQYGFSYNLNDLKITLKSAHNTNPANKLIKDKIKMLK